MESASDANLSTDDKALARRSKLRIQLVSRPKLSLKRLVQNSPKPVLKKPVLKLEKLSMNRKDQKDARVGRAVRSCLASVEAMASTQNDFKVGEHLNSGPSNVSLLQGCLAAVKATIEAQPAREFTLEGDSTSRPTSRTPAGKAAAVKQEVADNKDASETPKGKRGRPKAAPKPASQPTPVVTEAKPRGRPGRKPAAAPEQKSPAASPARGRGAPAQKSPVRKVKEEPEPSATPAGRRGRPPKAAVVATPTTPRGRGRPKRVEAEVPKKEESEDKPAEEAPKKRGRGRPPAVRTEEQTSAAKAASSPARGTPRGRGAKAADSAEDTDKETAQDAKAAGDESAPEDASKPRRGRGRPPAASQDDAKQAKGAPTGPRGRGARKNVLKVALPIRPRSLRGQDTAGEAETSTADAPASPVKRPSDVSKAGSASPSGAAAKTVSPTKPAARTVKVTASKKKPVRTSRGSDTDTAEETLDEEEHLRELEKKKRNRPKGMVSPTTSTLTTAAIVTCSPPAGQVITTAGSQLRTITVKVASPRSLAAGAPHADEPKNKRAKLDADDNRPKVPLFEAPAIVQGKRERKRKVMDDFEDPKNALQAPAGKSNDAAGVQKIVGGRRVEISTVAGGGPGTSKPTVTVVSPMMITKPGVTIVTPSSLHNTVTLPSSIHSGAVTAGGIKPIVITVPPNGLRPTLGAGGGVVKTIVMPRVLTRPAGPINNMAQIRSIRLSTATTGGSATTSTTPGTPGPRVTATVLGSSGPRATSTPLATRPAPGGAVRILSSPIRSIGATSMATTVTSSTGSTVVMRPGQPGMTVTHGGLAPRIVTTSGVRPSIIRGPRIVTTLSGGFPRPRLLPSMPGGARIVTVRPNMAGALSAAIRQQGGVPAAGGKVIVRSVAPIVPQRHITVQATPSTGAASNNTMGGVKVTSTASPSAIVSRSPAIIVRPQGQLHHQVQHVGQQQHSAAQPKVVVRTTEAGSAMGPQAGKRVQQIVKPVERKPPPKKVVVHPRKVTTQVTAKSATATESSEGTSAVEKLLQEPQLPKVGKKPLTKKQKSMRKTDLIKTSTRSRRRGTDLQIDYNEDRLGMRDESDSRVESPHSEEIGSPDAVEQTEDGGQRANDDIPVAVVEVFLSQDEVKLREVHSPTKQDLVDLSHQPAAAHHHGQASLGGAPEGFFTTAEGIVEGVEGPFASGASGDKSHPLKGGLVSSSDNAFARALMLSDDALLKKRTPSKRKTNPLTKE